MNAWTPRFKIHAFNYLVILSLVISSCMPTGSVGSKRSSSNSSVTQGTNSNGTNSNGNSSAIPDVTATDGSSSVSSQKVELSHLVDPFTGTYKKKITIPKNYKGYLYIAGLNLSVLSSKIIKVRLNFGVDRQSIILPATLARAPGITPKTDIQVLVIDMKNRPFQDMRLPYDLYDYTDYNSDSSLEPVTDPIDGNLYCRGVKLADDPTFKSSSDTGVCKNGSDKCLYSYAKVADTSFYDASNLTSTPYKPQIWSSSTIYNSSLVNGMCLADNSPTNFSSLFSAYIPSGLSYLGPYRPINQNAWYISESALFASTTTSGVTTYTGLFETGMAADKSTWYRSLLFPRAGKVSLGSNINYIGSTSKFGLRSKMVSDSTGFTQYMDGCSIRAQNYDSSVNEGIGSCNVLANVEIFYMKDTSEISITTSTELKIQLTKASLTNSEGKQVLSSSFKTCDSSAMCGSEECCYNNRCWSKDLVSQCVDDVAQTGNRELGTSCTSDYQCASLCCNASSGACAAHTPGAPVPILCSKSSGQACVSQEFCAKEYVPVCKLYKNGLNADGTLKCTVRCPTVATYGSCVGGSCIAPKGATDTSTFDLTTCAGAIDP